VYSGDDQGEGRGEGIGIGIGKGRVTIVGVLYVNEELTTRKEL